MAYATQDDFIKTFSKRETVSLTDEARTGEVGAENLENALERSSAIIDGYLVGRYSLPWADTPRILTGYCCDIARYQLASDYNILTEEIKLRYDDAIKFLTAVASGKINLGPATSGGAALQSSSQFSVRSGIRQFGRESTGWGAF